MIDMLARMPGPRNWAVWLVLLTMLVSAIIAAGALATASGVFLSSLLGIKHSLGGWFITVFAFAVAWIGKFRWIKITMSVLVITMVTGVMWVAVTVFPGWAEFLSGFLPNLPDVPAWALEQEVGENPWKEILPLLGWGAGGFASQVWYTYWVIGAGYGAAEKDGYGRAADIVRLKGFGMEDARKLRGWSRIIYYDSTLAMILGMVITLGFLIAGAGVLGQAQIAPSGESVALQLSEIFASKWTRAGGTVFLLGGTAALAATLVGHMAGWPRLLADAIRICIPAFNRKFEWLRQFRLILVFIFLTNMIMVYSFNYRPVVLVKLAALMEGLLLTPLQALWILVGLYVVMPRLFNPEVGRYLRPGWILAAGLILAALVFGYFCVVQLPTVL
jgi:hypothetical protein